MTSGRPLLAWPSSELEALVVSLGGRAFHARIAREQLVAQGVTDYASMTALPLALRESLGDRVPLSAGRPGDAPSVNAIKMMMVVEQRAR